jgi:signal peptidase
MSRSDAWGWLRVALTAAVLVAWFLLLRPQGLGGPAEFAVVSGRSMLPTMHTGDLAIVHRQSAYRVGQVIEYRIPKGQAGAGGEIVHRIVGGDGVHGFLVQGDNRTAPDLWRPRTGDVVGSLWVNVPKAGWALAWIRQPAFIAAFVAFVAAGWFLLGRTAADDDETPPVVDEPSGDATPPSPDDVRRRREVAAIVGWALSRRDGP